MSDAPRMDIGLAVKFLREYAHIDEDDEQLAAYLSTKEAVPSLTWAEHIKRWAEFKATRAIH